MCRRVAVLRPPLAVASDSGAAGFVRSDPFYGTPFNIPVGDVGFIGPSYHELR